VEHNRSEKTQYRGNSTENLVTFWTRGFMPYHGQSVWKMECFG